MSDSVPSGSARETTCRACGAANAGAWAFCTQCGTPRDPVDAPVSPAPVTPLAAPPPVEPSGGLSTPATLPVMHVEGFSGFDPSPTLPVFLAGATPLGSDGAAPSVPMAEGLHDPPTIPLRTSAIRNVFVPVTPVPEAPAPSALPPMDAAVPSRGSTPAARGGPPTATVDHQGAPLRAEDDLFVPPPPEIGVICSAATSLTRGGDGGGLRLLRALPWACLFGGLTAALVELAMKRYAPAPDRTLAVLRWIPSLLVFLGVLWMRLPARRVLSYVGTDGIALCDVRFRFWPPHRPPLVVTPFAGLSDLTVDISHQQGTLAFAYVWRGADGRERFRIARRYRTASGSARPARAGQARLYDFCRAAERAWTLRVVAAAKAMLAQADGAFIFPVRAPNCSAIRVQGAGVTFALTSGDAAVPADMLTQVAVTDGKVHFATEEGVISLPCADVGNIGALLLVLAHHLRVVVR